MECQFCSGVGFMSPSTSDFRPGRRSWYPKGTPGTDPKRTVPCPACSNEELKAGIVELIGAYEKCDGPGCKKGFAARKKATELLVK